MSVAYLPVADPTSVTLTRCGGYTIRNGETNHSDVCVSSREVILSEDLEVFVECEYELTTFSRTTGYQRIYYRVD